MPQGKVTSADVARLAGVSRSAVSRVFTTGASASADTVTKVRRAAAELGYRPNVLARAMVSGRSRMIGVVVAGLENQFYPDLLEKLSGALQAQGYHALVFMASQRAGNIDSVVEELLDYQVDGLIATSLGLGSDMVARCAAGGVPVVLVNRMVEDASVAHVSSDNHEGGRAVARFLLRGGHRRIGYIAGWEGASTQAQREAGFRAGLAQGGAALAARAVGDFDRDIAAEATRTLFTAEDPPDALFIANDHMAFAVLDCLRFELGLRVPEDVSVVGFDDVRSAASPAYRLTTVRQKVDSMVEAVVEMLLARIDGRDAPAARVIDAPLIVRDSARRPPD